MSPAFKEQVCALCGRSFLPLSNRQKYCATCGRHGGIKSCTICAVEFQMKGNTTGLFCSVACFQQSRRLERTVPCAACGTPFYKNSKGQATCSLACRGVMLRKERRPCAECGGPVRLLKNRYCSQECGNRHRAKLAALTTPERRRRALHAHLRRKYGIGVEEFDALWAIQEGRCAICRRAMTRDQGNRAAACHVDHDHVTTRVRGLLCNACNLGLGRFSDDPECLEAAAAYLRRAGLTDVAQGH